MADESTRLIVPAGRGRRQRRETLTLNRHLGLGQSIAMIVGGVAGSGIFISPTGVTAGVGSVGASLLIWSVAGLFNLLLALCYAELGAVYPLAGGDFVYTQKILGDVYAFMGLWVTVVLIGPCAAVLMARTIATYGLGMIERQCDVALSVLIACLCTLMVCELNFLSPRWSTRLITFLSVLKVCALLVIIGTGAYVYAHEGVAALENSFAGSNLDAGSLVSGFLPGFVAYMGWDGLNTLAEEMNNPVRDLPLAATIAMILVTLIYVTTNLAYFAVLSPAQFIQSDAVAATFAREQLGRVAWFVPICVILSSVGSEIGVFMTYPRSTLAGARSKHLPFIFKCLHVERLTPLPAIILLGLLTICLSSAYFLDIQSLLQITSVMYQIRVGVTLIALMKFKVTSNQKSPSVIRVPFILVLASLFLIVAIILIAIYRSPLLNGSGPVLFLVGLPVYWISQWGGKRNKVDDIMRNFSKYSQLLFKVSPSEAE